MAPYAVVGGSATLTWGEGILNADPLFASGTDLHLKSRYGRWDPAAGQWTNDAVTSPASTREPQRRLGERAGTQRRRVNMGAYGNTAQASKSPRRACSS